MTNEEYKEKVSKAAASNSKTTAIKLKCLDCSAYQVEEIRNCPVTNCALYSFRGYYKPGEKQKKTVELSNEKRAELSERMKEIRKRQLSEQNPEP